MKKQLLALAIAATTAFAGMAETVAFVAEGASYSGEGETTTISNAAGADNLFGSSPKAGDTATFTNGDITISFERNNTANSKVSSKQVRWYQNDVITITPLNGATVTNITLTAANSYYSTAVNVETGSTTGTLSTGSATRTWNGSTVDDITLTAGAQTRFTALEITYTPGVAAAVEKPVIELVIGDYGCTVELSCETEGAEIFYTTDGEEPTAASTKYTAPFVVWENVTVKAIAIKGEDKSAVATKALEVPMILDDLSGLAGADEDTINEFFGGSVKFILNSTLTYVYQAGNYLYLTDGTYTVLLFGYDQPTYAAGDTFSRLEGTYTYYNGLAEVKDFTLSAATAGTNVKKPMEIEDASFIASNTVNSWYTIKGVEISNVSGKNATMTDGEGNKVALYNQLGCEDFAAGKNLTVTGFVGIYRNASTDVTTVQFWPTEIVNESGEEVVAEPEFSLESGAYTENTEIVITCPTEGATIVYSINLGDIIEAEAPVTITLTENMEIHAYATKEGMGDSEVVEMTYTIKGDEPIDDTKATFDFSEAGFKNINFSEVVNYPGTNQNVVVDGIEMSNNGVSLTTTKGTSNPSAIFQNGGNLRCYVGSTLTFSVGSEYTISKVTFTATDFNLALADGMAGTLASKVWTAPAEATRAIQQVKDLTFNSTKTSKITNIEVEFAKIATGIESVEVEEGAEAAVYYNLQGVRVANPENGLYIRVQGKTASKVYVR